MKIKPPYMYKEKTWLCTHEVIGIYSNEDKYGVVYWTLVPIEGDDLTVEREHIEGFVVFNDHCLLSPFDWIYSEITGYEQFIRDARNERA